MMQAILDAHALLLDSFEWAFLSALLVGAALPVAGVYLVLRRVPFLAIALPQSAFAGMACGLAFFGSLPAALRFGAAAGPDGAAPEPAQAWLGGAALVFVALVLGVLALAARGRGAPSSGLHAALAYVTALAASEVFTSMSPMGDQRLEPLVHGQLIAVSRGDFLVLAASVVPIAALLAGRHARWLFVSAEPEVARALGLRAGLATAAVYLLLGGIVAASVPIVGPLVVFALLLGPAILFRPAARSVRGLVIGAAATGLLSSWAGSIVSVLADWPLGAAIAATAVVLGGLLLGLARACRARAGCGNG